MNGPMVRMLHVGEEVGEIIENRLLQDLTNFTVFNLNDCVFGVGHFETGITPIRGVWHTTIARSKV